MSSQPTRIAFCITDLDPGGAERALVQLVTRLDRRRWDPIVFSLMWPGSLLDDLHSADIPVNAFDAARSWQAPGVILKLRRALLDWKPQILQTFLFHANLIGRLAGSSAKVPHIVSGIRVAEKRARGHLLLDRWTDRLVDAHVAVSQSVADFSIRVGKLPARKMVVIRNGVDLDRFANADRIRWTELGLPETARVVLTVGRLDRQKGLLTLVQAAESITRQYPDVHFVFVGEGPQREELEREIGNRGLSGRVLLPGWRSDIPRLLRSAELFVLPSQWEGLPNAVLEAMAAGLPVICSRVEGAEELIEPNRSGLLVSPGNAEQLRETAARLLADSELQKRLGNAAQERVRQEFSWDRMAASYDALYQRLLQAS